MISKTKVSYTVLLVGMVILLLGMYLTSKDVFGDYIGITFGIGSGLLGVGAANVFSNWIYNKNPNLKKLKDIELNDERNKFLHYKIGSEIYKINVYLLSILAVAAAILKAPLWIILSLSVLLITDNILYFLIFNKNNKQV